MGEKGQDLASVRYRAATPRDALIAAEVIAAGFATYAEFERPGWRPRRIIQEEPEVFDRLSRGDVHARLAFGGVAAVGFAGWLPAFDDSEPREPIPGRAHLWSLFVRPEWWGSGVAQALHEWVVTGMRDSGYNSARLWTPRNHARARTFYERRGWSTTGVATYFEHLDLDLVPYEIYLG